MSLILLLATCRTHHITLWCIVLCYAILNVAVGQRRKLKISFTLLGKNIKALAFTAQKPHLVSRVN